VLTTGDLKLPQLVLKARPHTAQCDLKRCCLEDLSSRLRSAEIGANDVDLQITDRVPGRVGVGFTQAEDVAIFVGRGVATRCLQDSPMMSMNG
jgi:hypothetical protein